MSESNENHSVSVKKKVLLDVLWENGVRVRDSNFEDMAKHHLHELLNLPEGECSGATNDIIAAEALKFRQRVRLFWGPKSAKNSRKLGTTKKALDDNPYFQQDIVVEVVPASRETPDPPYVPEVVTPAHKRSGPYKSYLEKLPDAQRLDRRAVREQHDAHAILEAAPKAATSVGLGTFGKAIKEMAKDPDVNPQLALDGMKNQSMYKQITFRQSINN